LKLKYDALLSNFAFNCNLRHYTKEVRMERRVLELEVGGLTTVHFPSST